MKKYYFACDWNEISTSIITTPAKLTNYDGTKYDIEFYSGFFTPHLNINDEIEMNIVFVSHHNSGENTIKYATNDTSIDVFRKQQLMNCELVILIIFFA